MMVRYGGRQLGMALGVALTAGSVWASDARVELTVSGADAAKGSIRARIFTANGYMDDPTAETAASVDDSGAVRLVFEVPAGEYAIASFWDENDNGELDTRIFGIPKERVGMSNNAKGRMGPAKWKDAKFNAEAGTTTMAIDLVDAT